MSNQECQESWTNECRGTICSLCQFCQVHAYEANEINPKEPAVTRFKVYFARSQANYGTPQDKRDLALIEKMGWEVIDPKVPGWEGSYADEGMEYFYKAVRRADAVVFRAHPDGSIPTGVYGEVTHDRNKPVFELPSGILRRKLSVEQTREYLHEVGQR